MDPIELLETLYTILLTKFLSINSFNRVICCRFSGKAFPIGEKLLGLFIVTNSTSVTEMIII